jgi:hypothetical protein
MVRYILLLFFYRGRSMGPTEVKSLVIMAAGMGSRYGGLKQLDPVGPNGELLIHYTVYDAARAGFGRVVFVIRRDFEAEFAERIGRHMPKTIRAAYAHQDLEELPPDRQKPWGTGHAVLVCRDVVDGPFGVVNADDYYGRDAVASLFAFLDSAACDEKTYGMIGYRLKNTVSPHGAVTRGICRVEGGLLVGIEETGGIQVRGDDIGIERGGSFARLDPDTFVSMNIWGFHPNIFGHLSAMYDDFRAAAGDDPKAEFLIPKAVGTLVEQNLVRVRVIDTDDRWFGMTHREDRETVVAEIARLIAAGVYPERLV